jgi:hypothetical protein
VTSSEQYITFRKLSSKLIWAYDYAINDCMMSMRFACYKLANDVNRVPCPDNVYLGNDQEFRFKSCDFSFNLFPVWQPYC